MQTADIPYQRAKEFIEKYFVVYSGIKKYIEDAITSARELGYSQTMYGRRRYLPELHSSIQVVKKAAERMAVNTPIQGTSADMLKAAMIKIHKLIKGKEDIKMLLQVHDELVFEVAAGKEKKYFSEIKEIMENILKLDVPVIVEAKVGVNWGEMEKI
jgi:DNA polymerase-1